MKDNIRAVTVLSLSMLTVLCSQAIAPLLGSIREEFPEVSDMGIQMVVLLPPFCIMVANIFMSKLRVMFRQKSLLLIGLLFYTVGGVGGIFCSSYWQLIGVRLLLGIGCGLVMPFAQLLITQLFTGKMVIRLTGLTAAMTYLSGIFASLLIAVIPPDRWRTVFVVYGVGLLIGIASYLYIPGTDEKNRRAVKVTVSRKIWLVVFEMCFVNMAFYGITSNLSLFLEEVGKNGNFFASGINACFMIMGFLVGVIYEKIRRCTGNGIMIWGYVWMSIGYLFLWIHNTTAMIVVGASIVGGSYSLIYPSIYLYAKAEAETSEERSKAVSLVIIATFAGQFLSGIWMKVLWRLGVVHSYGEEYFFWVVWLILLLCFEYVRNKRYAIEVKI